MEKPRKRIHWKEYALREWGAITKQVKRGLTNLGRDIPIATYSNLDTKEAARCRKTMR